MTPALDDLDQAWASFLARLEAAGAALKDPACYPPPASDRNNAEGYRYLLGHLHRLIETEVQQDPDWPYIQRHPGLVSKYTIDNADCLYLYAPIRPGAFYRLSGQAAEHGHWTGPRDPGHERYAPNYLIFEAHTVGPGDSGTTQELFDGSRLITDKLDSKELRVEPDGAFEVLIAPERPPGHEGNFIATRVPQGTPLPRGDIAPREIEASHLYIRELFGDWQHEFAIDDLFIERLDADGEYPMPRNATMTARQLRSLGRLLENHSRYWTTMYGELLDPFQQTPEKRGPGYLPVNDLYPPRINRTDRGGGQATNAMTGGIFKLEPDQALVVEFECSLHPNHLGFHLGNYWGESLDFANHVSSLNHLQSHRDQDGAYRYVVSPRDPASRRPSLSP